MKLGVTGSRTITDFDFIPYLLLQNQEFRNFCAANGFCKPVECVISGGAKGVDSSAYAAAVVCGIKNICFLPDRKKYPGFLFAKACLERNKKIAETCDILLAVWDGKSKGTLNTIEIARSLEKAVFIVRS